MSLLLSTQTAAKLVQKVGEKVWVSFSATTQIS